MKLTLFLFAVVAFAEQPELKTPKDSTPPTIQETLKLTRLARRIEQLNRDLQKTPLAVEINKLNDELNQIFAGMQKQHNCDGCGLSSDLDTWVPQPPKENAKLEGK